MKGWPHVTDAIMSAGLIDTAYMTDFDRDRGSALHECARLVVEGTLDRESVDPVVAGRLAQFERFLVEVQPRIIGCEMPVESAVYRYCGRLDLLAEVNHQRAVIDLKGPTQAPWHGVQTAAYQHALTIAAPMRYTLHLDDDFYRLVAHKDRNDWAVFIACLTLHNYKLRHGLAEPSAREEMSA